MPAVMKRMITLIVCLWCTVPALVWAQSPTAIPSPPQTHSAALARSYVEQSRFSAPQARQAVAADKKHVYAINNTSWVKYTPGGDSLGAWRDTSSSALKHMNSGVVVGRKLYCAHSNYPQLPMSSSIEIFDTRTLRHVGSVSFGIDMGSCTWVLPAPEGWYVFFAHYENKSRQPGCDVGWSQLVEYDKRWRKRRGWVLPAALLPEIRPYSLSGAVLIGDVFYCTGHDARMCYLLRIPSQGPALEWIGSVPVPFNGQGIALDAEGALWGIDRKSGEVIRSVRSR